MDKGGGTARDLHVMTVYAVVAFFSFLIFGVLHIIAEQNVRLGYLELAAAVAVFLSVLHLRVSRNIVFTRFCFLLTVLVMLIVMLATGGTQGTGILWLYTFPVAAFFLAGRTQGIYWSIALFAAIGLLWAGSYAIAAPLYYADITVRQLLATLLVVTIGLFVYQRSRENWEHEAAKSQAELKAYLKKMTALHSKVDRTKSEFVTLTSHQLRTPISAIRWFSEMLLSGDAGKLSVGQHDAIKGIQDSNYRLGLIVDAMLTVSSLEMGDMAVRPEPTDIAALSRKMLTEVKHQYAGKELTVHQDYAAHLPVLPLDTNIVKQILRNLFSNAYKYTPEHGTITVYIGLSDTKLAPKSAGSIVLTVTDTGYGIPAEQQHDVFAKLFRAENIKAKDTDGTGLGLYIVKAMTDLVGGRVSFTSEENKGSTFMIELPLEGMRRHEVRVQ